MASSFLVGRPTEVPSYELKRLPDGRWHLEHHTKIVSASSIVPSILEAWGTLYRGDTSAGTNVEAFAGLRLIDGGIARIPTPTGSDEGVVRIYEQLPEFDEIVVGKPLIVRGDDGRITAVVDSLQLSTANATPQKVGATACPVWPVALAVTGTAATDLLARSKHGLLAGDPVKFSALTGGAGLVTATTYYVIASGLTADAFKLSATSGGAAIDFTTNITAATLALDVVLILASEEAPDDGALRRIKRTYVNKGVIATSTKKMGTGITQVTWVSVQTREDPPGSVVGVSTEKPFGVPVYTITVLQGSDGGSLLGEAGAAKLALQYQRLVNFDNPGTVDIQTYVVPSPDGVGPDGQGIKFVQTPRTTFKVKADVFVFYQTAATLAAEDKVYDSAAGLWNPADWPAIQYAYTPLRGSQIVNSEGYPGYRMLHLGESPKTLTAQTVQVGLAWTLPVVLGTICTGDNGFAPVHSVTLSGGPVDPSNERYVLDVDIEPAVFELADGTKVHRKTIVVATITPET